MQLNVKCDRIVTVRITLYCGEFAYLLLPWKSNMYYIFSVTQHTNHTVSCLAVHYIFTLSQKRNDFREEIFKRKTYCDVLYNFCWKHF